MIKFAICIIFSLTLTAAILPVRTATAPSYLVNPDFESGERGEPSGWTRSFYPEGEGIADCVFRSSGWVKSGHWSLKIDTGPALGKNVIFVFNGRVSEEAARLRGKSLVLSGWIYVAPGTALRPIGMRLRVFGKDKEGQSIFLTDVLEIKVMGRTGRWVPFQASGAVPDVEITGMDLHCGIQPDTVRSVQYLDGLRLVSPIPPLLEIRLPRTALWRDEASLPVEIKLNGTRPAGSILAFRLIDGKGKAMARWSRPLQAATVGLPLPKAMLAEGRYRLRTELRSKTGPVLASTASSLEIAVSPWENAPGSSAALSKRAVGKIPEAFQVMGTAAPANLPDVVPVQPETMSASERSPTWARQGFAVFSRHYLDPVSPWGKPRPGELGPVRLFACPGEYEPATLSVRAIRSQKGVRVTVSDLGGKGGSIATSNIDVRVVRTVKGLPPFLEKRPEWVDIPEGQTRTFWLTLRVPPEARPGFYRGEIRIAAGNSSLLPERIPLLVRVLPLKLPPPRKGYGFWWKMDRRWNGYYAQSRKEALSQIRKQFILLKEHGCNMVSCYGMPKMTKADDGTITFDFEQDHWGHDKFSLADFFRLGRETGFLSPKVTVQYPGADSLRSEWIARSLGMEVDSKAFADFYRDACKRIDLWAKNQGFRLAFACVDEIGNSEERRQEALRFYRVADEAGVLTSVTDNSMHGGVHLMGQSRFDSIIEMRLYNFITPEMIDHTRRSGDILWLYNMASMGWDPKADRFAFGLLTERCGAAGFSQWAFQWPGGNSDPYQAASAGQIAGYHYALPSPDGPLPTLGLEGIREGIDDARYLSLLPPKSRTAILREIEPLSTALSGYLEKRSGGFFDLLRWKIAREALQRKRGS